MNDTNLALLEKNRDILSIRDLATGTNATYTSYLTNYINWVEENLPGRSLSDVTWEEIRSYKIPVIHNGLCDTRHRQWLHSKKMAAICKGDLQRQRQCCKLSCQVFVQDRHIQQPHQRI